MNKALEDMIYKTELEFYNQSSDLPAIVKGIEDLQFDYNNSDDKKAKEISDIIVQQENKKSQIEQFVKMLRIKLDYLYELRNDKGRTSKKKS